MTTIVSATERRLAPLAEGFRQGSSATLKSIRRDSSETIANVGRVPAETVSVLTDRLPSRPTGSLSSLLGHLANPATIAATLPFAGSFQTGGGSQDSPLSFPEPPQASFFSRWAPIVSGGYGTEDLTLAEFGGVKEVGPASDHGYGQGMILSATAASSAGVPLDRAATHGPGSPGPLNVPLPAPGPPGAIAPGSGDAFFVPFVALLALLALVAPANMRRLREAPDFRASTPFVCALERPG